MRIIEITDQPSIVVNNEEEKLLEFLYMHDKVGKQDLTERQQYLIDNLVNKNLVIRKVIDGTTTYFVSPRIR